jgi:hypothetical protein
LVRLLGSGTCAITLLEPFYSSCNIIETVGDIDPLLVSATAKVSLDLMDFFPEIANVASDIL